MADDSLLLPAADVPGVAAADIVQLAQRSERVRSAVAGCRAERLWTYSPRSGERMLIHRPPAMAEVRSTLHAALDGWHATAQRFHSGSTGPKPYLLMVFAAQDEGTLVSRPHYAPAPKQFFFAVFISKPPPPCTATTTHKVLDEHLCILSGQNKNVDVASGSYYVSFCRGRDLLVVDEAAWAASVFSLQDDMTLVVNGLDATSGTVGLEPVAIPAGKTFVGIARSCVNVHCTVVVFGSSDMDQATLTSLVRESIHADGRSSSPQKRVAYAQHADERSASATAIVLVAWAQVCQGRRTDKTVQTCVASSGSRASDATAHAQHLASVTSAASASSLSPSAAHASVDCGEEDVAGRETKNGHRAARFAQFAARVDYSSRAMCDTYVAALCDARGVWDTAFLDVMRAMPGFVGVGRAADGIRAFFDPLRATEGDVYAYIVARVLPFELRPGAVAAHTPVVPLRVALATVPGGEAGLAAEVSVDGAFERVERRGERVVLHVDDVVVHFLALRWLVHNASPFVVCYWLASSTMGGGQTQASLLRGNHDTDEPADSTVAFVYRGHALTVKHAVWCASLEKYARYDTQRRASPTLTYDDLLLYPASRSAVECVPGNRVAAGAPVVCVRERCVEACAVYLRSRVADGPLPPDPVLSLPQPDTQASPHDQWELRARSESAPLTLHEVVTAFSGIVEFDGACEWVDDAIVARLGTGSARPRKGDSGSAYVARRETTTVLTGVHHGLVPAYIASAKVSDVHVHVVACMAFVRRQLEAVHKYWDTAQFTLGNVQVLSAAAACFFVSKSRLQPTEPSSLLSSFVRVGLDRKVVRSHIHDSVDGCPTDVCAAVMDAFDRVWTVMFESHEYCVIAQPSRSANEHEWSTSMELLANDVTWRIVARVRGIEDRPLLAAGAYAIGSSVSAVLDALRIGDTSLSPTSSAAAISSSVK